jgi:hypothetical protein
VPEGLADRRILGLTSIPQRTIKLQAGQFAGFNPYCSKNFTGVKVKGQGMAVVFYELFIWIQHWIP